MSRVWEQDISRDLREKGFRLKGEIGSGARPPTPRCTARLTPLTTFEFPTRVAGTFSVVYRATYGADPVDYALKVIQPTCKPERVINEIRRLELMGYVLPLCVGVPLLCRLELAVGAAMASRGVALPRCVFVSLLLCVSGRGASLCR
jgi:hypothetical protein